MSEIRIKLLDFCTDFSIIFIMKMLKLDDIDSKPLSELPFIPLFVYGTLRLGGSLHHLIVPHILEQVDNVYIFGRLHSSTQGLWPVVRAGGCEKVHGSLFALEIDLEVMASIFKEELLFGYDLAWNQIYESDGNEYSKALVCTWETDEFVGDKISHGDWLKHLN